MFWEFFWFELRFRAKSLSTYVYFLIWLAFSFFCVASESFGPVANANGKILLNGPWANSIQDAYALVFGIIVIAAIFGTSILRDFQRDTVQILFTKPFSKFAYLGGRWSGSFVITVFAFSGLMAGTFLGTFAPWADHARIAPNHLVWYLQPFLSIVVIQIFYIGSLFFAVAALSRKIFIVYLQGVVLFMLYILGITIFSATRSLEHFWSGISDPIGLLMIDRMTRYWSVVEKNNLLLPWDFSGYSPGVFLYNRLLWSAVGVAALAAVWGLFPMSVEALTAKSQSKRAAKARQQEEEESRPVRSRLSAALPRVRQTFGTATTFAQYLSLTRLRIRTITREVPFWGIVGLLIAFAVNNGYFAGRVAGADVWPVTYLMLQAVEGSATLFFFIVAALYAAELIWRERDTRFDGIHDALPIGETTDWLSKLTAIVFIELCLLSVAMLVGMLMQTVLGYYQYEILAVRRGALPGHPAAGARHRFAGLVRADDGVEQVHRSRHRDRCGRDAADLVQFRLGKYPLSARRRAAVYLLGHERLRPLRARAVLGDLLLERYFCATRRGLHCLRAARRGGVAPGTQRARSADGASAGAGGRRLLGAGLGLGRLVLLQRARAQRISHGG